MATARCSAAPPAPVHPLHGVLGEAAAGGVRAACAACGMPGAVVGFVDDLAHGPLTDAAARAAYLRDLSADAGAAVGDC